MAWDVVWAQMAGRVSESEEHAREALELGKLAQARDAQSTYAIQVIALRRREDRLSDQVATITAVIEQFPSLVAWRAVLPLAHLAAGNLPAAMDGVRGAGRQPLRGGAAGHVLVHGDVRPRRDMRPAR